MIHRHLDYPADTPITELGDAALDDLLDNADFDAWRPLAREIAADPFGELAQRIIKLCEANPRYGTSPLWRSWITQRRAMAVAKPPPELTLADLRRIRGLSQAELASEIGMSQSDLSKAERRTDWKLSTVRAIVEGLGLRIRIEVHDEHGRTIGTLVPQTKSDVTGVAAASNGQQRPEQEGRSQGLD